MTNLIDIQSQIEKLQKQATEIKTKNFAATVQEILTKMQAFDITIKDLQGVKPSKDGKSKRGRPSAVATKAVKVPKVGKSDKKKGIPVAPKYRGPNNEVWSGRGLTPKWLTALIDAGQPKETFMIQPE